ncbi:hypothetical protein LZ554_007652 [Drepanopeziza brunnea f. sp. 'monogermtubi']|nr:hypothetical protein LZ554_007652 [Drepanopeziza brunnea f. sp. 'monogermtubi']
MDEAGRSRVSERTVNHDGLEISERLIDGVPMDENNADHQKVFRDYLEIIQRIRERDATEGYDFNRVKDRHYAGDPIHYIYIDDFWFEDLPADMKAAWRKAEADLDKEEATARHRADLTGAERAAARDAEILERRLHKAAEQAQSNRYQDGYVQGKRYQEHVIDREGRDPVLDLPILEQIRVRQRMSGTAADHQLLREQLQAKENARAARRVQLDKAAHTAARRAMEWERKNDEIRRRPAIVEEVADPLPLTWNWTAALIRRTWASTPLSFQVIFTVIFLVFTWSTLAYTYRFVFGLAFYIGSYTITSLGNDLGALMVCERVTKYDRPRFGDLAESAQRWFFLQKCLGARAGFRRQGTLSESGWLVVKFLADPVGISPVFSMIIYAICFYWVSPWVSNKFLRLYRYMTHAEAPLWAKVVWIVAATSIAGLFASNNVAWALSLILLSLTVGLIAVFINVLLARFESVWEAAWNSPLLRPILALYQLSLRSSALLLDSQQNRIQNGPTDFCKHLTDCHCWDYHWWEIIKTNDEKAVSEEDYRQRTAALSAELAAAQREAREAKETVIMYQNNFQEARSPLANGQPSGIRGIDPQIPFLKEKYDKMEQEYLNLMTQYKDDMKRLNHQVDSLQKNVNYAIGAGTDRDNALEALSNAKARIRALERSEMELSGVGMKLRQQLAAERHLGSDKCHDDAGCQKRITELKDNYDLAISTVREYDSMAIESYVFHGMPRKDAEHKTVRDFVYDWSIRYATMVTMGQRGFDTTDLQVAILKEQVDKEAVYKNRLERELVRLGGSLIDVRMGRDTTKPLGWKVDFMTYEQNNLRVFPIYQRLCACLADLVAMFKRDGLEPPVFLPEAPRNDHTKHLLTQSPEDVNTQIYAANDLVNPVAASFEILIEKLVVNECQRLFNHGMRLLTILDKGTKVEANTAGITKAQSVMKEVLHEVLDYIPAINSDSSERQLSPRKAKKYELYYAMQFAIKAYVSLIIENKREPPAWTLYPLSEKFNKPFDRPEHLILNLANHELGVLAHRLHQLVQYTDEYSLPGTRSGPPRIDNSYDPLYQPRWDQMVVARTFAELCVSHWNVHKSQKEVVHTDEDGRQMVHVTPNPVLLPLNVEAFQQVVGLAQRKTAEPKYPDDWRAVTVRNEEGTPLIAFLPPGTEHPSGHNKNDKEKGGNGASGNNNNNGNSELAGTAKELIRQKLAKEWHAEQNRSQQLYNYILYYGIKGPLPRFQIKSLRASADAKAMKHDISVFAENNNQYVRILTDNRKPLPKYPHKGGKFDPSSGY